MNVLAAALVVLLCAHGTGMIAYLVRVGGELRQVEQAGLRDPQRARRLMREAFAASLVMISVQLVILGMMLVGEAPPVVWWIWGVTLVISFLSVVWLDGVRQRLGRGG